MILPFYLLVFASTYFVMQRASAANFTQPLTRTDALYFAVTVFSTVGFGDITPKSEAARVVLIVQMLGDLALLGAGVRVLLGACAAASNDRARAARTARRPGEGRQDRAGRPVDLRAPQGAPRRLYPDWVIRRPFGGGYARNGSIAEVGAPKGVSFHRIPVRPAHDSP